MKPDFTEPPKIETNSISARGALAMKMAESSLVSSGASETSIALGFHAERLHDHHVWREVKKVAHRLAARDVKATFFVYPFRAAVAGINIVQRVRWLGCLGHEIAQHTHFYAGAKIHKNEKIDDLSDRNVVHCLERDFEVLRQSGWLPKAFTAGAWYVNDTVLDTLIGLGFDYDCSAQFPKPVNTANSPFHRWLRSPELYENARGRLICMPTTCSLGEWFKWGRKIRTDGRVSYQLIYLHDYDLLSFRNRLLLRCLFQLTKKEIKPLRVVVEQYLFRRGEPSCL